MDEIHRLTRVTARGLHLPHQAFNTDTDRGPKGKGRLMRVCGLRRLESPTIERVRRVPARGSGENVFLECVPRFGPLMNLATPTHSTYVCMYVCMYVLYAAPGR